MIRFGSYSGTLVKHVKSKDDNTFNLIGFDILFFHDSLLLLVLG